MVDGKFIFARNALNVLSSICLILVAGGSRLQFSKSVTLCVCMFDCTFDSCVCVCARV